MAKKITINGTNLLTSINDAWGGVNNTSSPITVYGTTVPAGAEWGINRGEVERFMKEQYNSKVGDIHWEINGTFYDCLGFATTADRQAYVNDPETYADKVLFRRQLPISTISTDSYICRLAGDILTSNNYVIRNKSSFVVHLRYQSIFIEGATSTSTNLNADGTIIIERSVNNGSSWTQVARLAGITSVDPTASNFPVTVDLGNYMVSDMNNRFRMRASFQYAQDGVTKTRYSSYVTYIVSSVNLAVKMETDWSQAITANASTTTMALNFRLFGAVSKNLTIKVDGTTFIDGAPYDSSYNNQVTQPITITDSSKAIFTHGVHEVQVYLTCSDGAGGTLTSDVMTYTIMVYNASTSGADLTQPYLLLQEVADSVENFVQSKICRYAVYNPSGDDMELTLIVCSSAQNYVTNPSTAYFLEQRVASVETQYDINATLEIEDQSGSTLNAFLQVLRNNNGTLVNFLYETTGANYHVIPVDNTGGYAPTAGKTFYLNPKLRSNAEDNPQRILNAAANNAEIESTWQNFKLGTQDGWLTDADGNHCLRVPAGSSLNILMNPFVQFRSQPNSSMTMDFVVKVSNVTNEDDPILRICEPSGNNVIGLRLRPMTGTMTTASHTTEDTSNFGWSEDTRTHITINIHNAVAPNAPADGLTTDGSVPTGTLSLVRVFINKVIEREFVFATNTPSEFCTSDMSNGGIFIGQEGADIDIYGMGIWASQQLSTANVCQNVTSAIPDVEDKQRSKREDDIMESGVINAEKVKTLGKNVLIWHGQEVWHGAPSKQKGWWEFYQYDANGLLIPELSGTISKETGKLPSSGQGTTAKTYYYWNIQTKFTDIEDYINVVLSDLHESITCDVDAENGKVYLKGGNLGKNFPLPTETPVAYDLVYIDGAQGVRVPDGWIDGNGKYRGMGYTIVNGVPLAQKLVLKINYASSMQSHIDGGNKMYNDLHTIVVGQNALQANAEGAMVAKHLEPFLFFTQASDNAAPVYRGPGEWGPGKMDKPTWGYVKSAYPLFTMIEGADNNKELTDMRVPFDDSVHSGDTYPKVYYHPENEAFMYRVDAGLQNSQKCIDFDGGKTVDISADQLDGTHLYAGEYPHPDIVNYIRSTWNFLFLHNPRIKPFITAGGTLGSFSDFTASTAAQDTGRKYWCSDYKLYRYDFADGAWVPAGLWNGSSYDEVLLTDSTAASGTLAYETYTAWNALSNNQKADYEGAVNAAFIAGIVAHAKNNIGNYFIIDSLKFHYAFQNHFIAGTDNCSKNTYYVLVPTAGTMGNWSGWKFQLHQDDVDTILATDNSGLQTKPYYIDRMHPYKEDDVLETDSLYEGQNNVLFNLCEEMWENTLEISDMLRQILTSMSQLTGGRGSRESDSMNGVWKALNRYFFDVQRYIPAMAYNEAARIRYEFPKLMNYTSDQRQVDPIEQSMGDQLQAELQWMKRRLVYMASYAAFGEFAPGSTANTGLSDLSQSFAMVMAALPNSTTQTSVYTFKLVPHQWLYPTAAIAQSGYNPHVRVAPNAANMPNGYFEISISPTSRSDDGITIYAINYYRSIGNIGDNCFDPNGTLNMNGKRLTQFTVEPTTYYSTTIGGGSITASAWRQLSDTERANYQPAFRCSGINIGSATRLSTLSFYGCSRVGGSTVDISSLTRAATIDMRYTNVLSVALPQTPTLTSIQMPALLTSLRVQNCVSLTTLSLQGYASLTQIVVTNCPALNSSVLMLILDNMRLLEVAATLVSFTDIQWTGVLLPLMRYIIEIGDRGACLLTGSIEIPTQQVMTYDMVATLITRYGNIRSTDNPLYISYPTSAITTDDVGIGGRKYIIPSWLGTLPAYWEPTELHPDEGLWLTIANGNNIAAVQHNGQWVPAVTWSLVGQDDDAYASFPDMYSSRLLVTNLYAGKSITVRVTVQTTSSTLTYEKNIGLWNRIPEVGDFAWTDGTFDKQDDQSKLLAGVVVMREILELKSEDGTETISYDDYMALSIEDRGNYSPTKARLWVYGTQSNISVPSSTFGGTGSSGDIPNVTLYNTQHNMIKSWGISSEYPAGIPSSKENNVYTNELMAAIQSSLVGRTIGRQLVSLSTNLFYFPLNDVAQSSFITSSHAITPSDIADETNTEPILGRIDNVDGTNILSNKHIGDDIGYKQNVNNSAMNDFATIDNNKRQMEFANAVLAAVISYLNIDMSNLPDGVDPQTGIPKTLQGYADMTLLIQRYYLAKKQTVDEENPVAPSEADLTWTDSRGSSAAVIRELMFPSVRLCNVWSPSDIPNSGITESMLNEQYKKGKWMLPAFGLLARIFNFLWNSSCTINASTGARSRSNGANVNINNASEAVSTPSLLPIFSNILARSNSNRRISIISNNMHWSCLQGYQYGALTPNFTNGYVDNIRQMYSEVIHPVCPFIFDVTES